MSTGDVEKEVSRQALGSIDTRGADVKMETKCAKQDEHAYRCAVTTVIGGGLLKETRAKPQNVTATVSGDNVVVDGLN